MILVTVGTQFFDELIIEVDRLAKSGAFTEPVLAQVGLSRYQPKHLNHVAFDPRLLDHARQASLIITHAGTGCVCEMIELGRPFIAVVNDTKAGNHQLEFLRQMSTKYDFCWASSPRDLATVLPAARPARSLSHPGVESLGQDVHGYLKQACYNPAPKRRSLFAWISPSTCKRTPAC